VLEKADTSFNTGNPEGFRVSPNSQPPKAADFACLRASGSQTDSPFTFRPEEILKRFATATAAYYCGIDFHARTMYLVVLDQAGAVRLDRN
jgi:hypothetical protein